MKLAEIHFDGLLRAAVLAGPLSLFGVPVPETSEENREGLQGINFSADCFMLFTGVTPSHTFRMGRIRFPLDLVAITRNRVTGVVHNVLPGSKTAFRPLADAVLETPGGWCVKNRVSSGTILTWSFL